MSECEESPRFEDVDWDEVGSDRRRVSPSIAMFAGGLVLLAGLYALERADLVALTVLLGGFDRLDWVMAASVVVLGSFVGLPALRRPRTTRRILRRLLSRPAYAAAATFLAALGVAGLVGPLALGSPELSFAHRFHAPYGFAGEAGWNAECLGEITQGEGITRYCEGTMTYPLGTNHRGHPLGQLLVEGARVALVVIGFTAAFVVPLAATVGVIAGFRGGRLDDLLMSYVDAQLCFPAIVAFVLGYVYWNASLLLLLVTFGLLSWGGIARLVRSETLQRREAGHVLVARSLGASPAYIARRHVVPNITNTLVPAVFHLLALLVLVEAGVAFLGFHDLELYSWGSTMQEGLDPPVTGLGLSMHPHEVWWVSTFPAIALTLTLASLKLVGDGLRDALDPRETDQP